MAPRRKKSEAQRKEDERIRKAARYRRLKEDPESAALMKIKEQEKYKKKKAKGQRKVVSEMSDREKRAARKIWKEHSKTHRQKKKEEASRVERAIISSQLQVEEQPGQEAPQQHPQPSVGPPSRQVSAGRKRIVKNRSLLVRRNQYLQNKIASLEKTAARQRQNILRLRKTLATTGDSNSPGKIVLNVMQENNPKVVRKKLLFGEVLEQEIKKNAKCLKTNKSKRDFTKVLIGDGEKLRKYGLVSKCASFIPRRALKGAIGNESTSSSPSVTKMIHSQVQNEVIAFLEEDENSRCLPGKKDCISKGGVKKQKRLLLADIKDLHTKFVATCGYKISYPTFCRFRPFWILPPDVNKRDTCLCQTHANFGLRLKTLNRSKIIKSDKIGVIKEQLCCVPPTLECYHRKCLSCKDNHILYGEDGEFDGSQVVVLNQWKTTTVEYLDHKTKKMKQTKRTVKLAMEKILIELIRETEENVDKLLEHEGNIFHQYGAMKYLKAALELDEVLIHCDFSENYATKYSSEIQAIHFGGNRQSVSLHTVVVYVKRGDTVSPYSLCTISQNLDHGPGAIWAHMVPVFSFVHSQIDQVTRVHFLSDGPSTQYRNKTIFYLLQHRLRDFFPKLTTATWNYSEAGHGKGAPDGVGGTIKRTADRIVAQGNDITDVDSLISALSRKLEKVWLFKIEGSSIQSMLESLPQDILPFKGTMKLHQVVWRKGVDHLEMNALSCFSCLRRCKHHSVGQHVSHASEVERFNDFEENLDDVELLVADENLEDIEQTYNRDLAHVQQRYNFISEEEAQLLTNTIATDNIIEQAAQENLGPGIQEIEEETFADHGKIDRSLILPIYEYVSSGLCYHCGGAINSVKKGLKCNICLNILFHEKCKIVMPNSVDQQPFQCCKNCSSLLLF